MTDPAIALREEIWSILRSGDAEAAMRVLELSSALPPPSEIPDSLTAHCIFDIAFEFERLGNDTIAMEQYRRVLQYRGTAARYPASAWFRLGVCLRRQGNYAQSIDSFRKSLTLAEGLHHLETLAHYYLAELLEAAEEYDAAERSFATAMARLPHPDIRDAHIRLAHGRCCWRIGDSGRAIDALSEVAQRSESPESAEAWRWLAEIAEASGDAQGAERAYREIIASPHAEPSLKAAAAYRRPSAGRSLSR